MGQRKVLPLDYAESAPEMSPEVLKVWEEKRKIGRLRFVLIYGMGMAVFYYVGFILLFAALVRFLIHDPVLWRPLLIITGPGSIIFGLLMAGIVWRRQERSYRRSLDRKNDDRTD